MEREAEAQEDASSAHSVVPANHRFNKQSLARRTPTAMLSDVVAYGVPVRITTRSDRQMTAQQRQVATKGCRVGECWRGRDGVPLRPLGPVVGHTPRTDSAGCSQLHLSSGR